MRTDGAISILEASYRLDVNEQDWLQGVADAAKTSFGSDSPSVFATIFTLEAGQMIPARMLMSPPHPELLDAINEVQSKAPPEALLAMYRSAGCDSLSAFSKRQGVPPEVNEALFAEKLHGLGVRDSAWVQGLDSTNRMVSFVAALANKTTLHPRTKHTWDRISVHMAAGLRLRGALASDHVSIDGAEAIFDASHTCLHAEGDAKEVSAQERLRDAARAVDKARLRGADATEALELWQGLFAGRWTVADTFDSDGRRLFVAMKNDPDVAEDRSLTRRERQVTALAALGRPDAIIAYTLGLANSSVQTHLTRAMQKMGVSSRAQLVELANTAGAPDA
jgi:DNA-binding CsgD family transcriptional regulator